MRGRLHVHLPVAVLEEEVVDVERAEIGLQRGVDVVEGDLLGLGLFVVDVDVELRLGDAEAAEQAGEPRVAVALVGEILDGPLQRPQARAAAVLDLQLEAARAAQAVDRRRAEDADPCRRDLAEFLAQPGDDRGRAELRFAGPFLERLEDHEHAADVADVRAQDGRVARQVDGVGDAGLFAGDFAHFADDLVGAVEGGAVGELRVEDQVALVLFGDKADGNGLETEVGESHQADVNQQHDRADSQQAGDHPAVDVDRDVEEPVEAAEECAEQFVDQNAGKPADDRAKGEDAGLQCPKRGCTRVGCGLSGAVPMSADFDSHQPADRREQEHIGQQAADDGDAGSRQRFLLHVAVLAMFVRFEQ